MPAKAGRQKGRAAHIGRQAVNPPGQVSLRQRSQDAMLNSGCPALNRAKQALIGCYLASCKPLNAAWVDSLPAIAIMRA